MSGCTGTNCRCVGFTLKDRCLAIQQYVRPEDVAHLIQRGRRTIWTPAPADSISSWLKQQFASGWLRYIPDPADCDRWGRPAETFRRRGGDCDDLAILVASLCRAMDVEMEVVIGLSCNGSVCDGHAWVEGRDEQGGFLLEATSGDLYRHRRPQGYLPQLKLTPESCNVSPGVSNLSLHVLARQINGRMPAAFGSFQAQSPWR